MIERIECGGHEIFAANGHTVLHQCSDAKADLWDGSNERKPHLDKGNAAGNLAANAQEFRDVFVAAMDAHCGSLPGHHTVALCTTDRRAASIRSCCAMLDYGVGRLLV